MFQKTAFRAIDLMEKLGTTVFPDVHIPSAYLSNTEVPALMAKIIHSQYSHDLFLATNGFVGHEMKPASEAYFKLLHSTDIKTFEDLV
jgi:hypothetical protein